MEAFLRIRSFWITLAILTNVSLDLDIPNNSLSDISPCFLAYHPDTICFLRYAHDYIVAWSPKFNMEPKVMALEDVLFSDYWVCRYVHFSGFHIKNKRGIFHGLGMAPAGPSHRFCFFTRCEIMLNPHWCWWNILTSILGCHWPPAFSSMYIMCVYIYICIYIYMYVFIYIYNRMWWNTPPFSGGVPAFSVSADLVMTQN